MPSPRRIQAELRRVDAVLEESGCGVELEFLSRDRRQPGETIVDFADLGPDHTLESAAGLAHLMRLVRAVRLAAPRPAESWLGDPIEAAARLRRAIGRAVVLEVKARMRLRFTVWTEHGVDEVDNVSEVTSDETAWVVHRVGHRLPIRVPRDEVVRQQTTRVEWLQVVGIER